MAGLESPIHHMAIVDFDCQVGPGTRVYQFASIVREAKVGVDCVIGPGTVIDGALVCDGVHIGPNVFIPPGVQIACGVFIGAGTQFCNDMWPRTNKTGWNTQALSLIADGKTIDIGPGVSIGANCTILPGTVINPNTMIAAGSVIQGEMPSNSLIYRNGKIVKIGNESERLEQRMRFL